MGCVGEVGCGGSLTVKQRYGNLNASAVCVPALAHSDRIPSETDSEGPFAAESAMTEEVSQG